MALKYVDNYAFWTTISKGTLTATYGTVTVSSGKLTSTTISSGVIISNRFTAQATYIVNLRFNVASLGNGNPVGMPGVYTPFVTLMDGGSLSGNVQAGIGVRSDGKLNFFRDTTPIGASSVTAIVADTDVTYYDLEYKITINNSSGSIQARLNGGVEIGPTGSLDTQQTANATADSMLLWGIQSGSNTNTPNMRIEHLIIMDGSGSAGNDFIGPVDVDLLPPTGDGTYTAWNFTGGATRWESVDELDPDDDTSYIFDGVVGDRNTFTHGNLPAGSTAVKAVGVWARARRDDGTTRAFKVLLRSSGSDQLGGVEQFVGDDYIWFFQPFEISPFTSSAWTVSEVNGCEYGAQVTT